MATATGSTDEHRAGTFQRSLHPLTHSERSGSLDRHRADKVEPRLGQASDERCVLRASHAEMLAV